MNGRDGLLNTLNQDAYDKMAMESEAHLKKELLEERGILPTVAKITEGEIALTMPQIEQAFSAARVELSCIQRKDFMQSLATQVQQRIRIL